MMNKDYALNSAPQGTATQFSVRHIDSLLETELVSVLKWSDASTIYICDYGCGMGPNSVAPLTAIVTGVRKMIPECPIVVVLNDLPENNFSSLFASINTSSFESFKKLYFVASGVSFYNQILPDNSVHIGYSSSAMHWLSTTPEYANGCSFMNAVTDELQVTKEMAALDWKRLLTARCTELVSGGFFFLSNNTTDPITGATPIGSFTALLYEVAKVRMSSTELKAFSIPHYWRTSEEIEDSEILASCGFRLIRPSIVEDIIDPFVSLLHSNKIDLYAQKIVGCHRSWTEQSVRVALSVSNDRSPDNISEELCTFYNLVTKEVIENPNAYALTFKQCFTVLQKL